MLNPGLHPHPGPQNGSYIPIPKGLKPIMPIPKVFIPIPNGLKPKLKELLPHPELKLETVKLL